MKPEDVIVIISTEYGWVPSEVKKAEFLSSLKIVERLKDKIKEIETNNDYHKSQGCGTSIIQSKPFLDLLQSIYKEEQNG